MNTAWIDGGLRYLHGDTYAQDAPVSLGLTESLCHNQQLLHATFAPRALVNNLWPRDGSGNPVEVACLGYGRVLAVWGRFPRGDGMDLVLHVCTALTSGSAYSCILRAFSTPALVRGDELVEDLVATYSNTEHYDDATVDTTSEAWRTLYLRPNPGNGGFFYVVLTGEADSATKTNTSTVRVLAVSVRERRRGF